MNDPSHVAFALPPDLAAARIGKRKQPVQARSLVTADAIIEATLQVLMDGGVPGMNTVRVAERAGVSVGTLYQYYPNKRSLLLAIKVQYLERVMGAIHATIRGQIGRPLEQALTVIVPEVLRIKTDNLRFTSLMRTAGDWPLVDAGMRAAFSQLCEAMEALFRAADPHMTNTRMRASVLVAALDGSITSAVTESPSLLQDESFRDALLALALGFARELSGRSTLPQ